MSCGRSGLSGRWGNATSVKLAQVLLQLRESPESTQVGRSVGVGRFSKADIMLTAYIRTVWGQKRTQAYGFEASSPSIRDIPML